MSEQNHPPFFMFGAQKSGTTLLTTLLSQNPKVRIATDSVFLNIFFPWISDKALELSLNGNPSNIYLRGSNLRSDVLAQTPSYDDVKWLISTMYQRYFTGSTKRLSHLLSMNKDPARESFIRSEELTPFEHGQTIDPCELFMLAQQGAKWSDIFHNLIMQIADASYPIEEYDQDVIYGEKTPGHIQYVSLIDKAYPAAKFIFVLRNPIANIASYYKRDNSGFDIGHKHDLDEALKSYAHYINPFIHYYQREPGRFHIVKYEDLVAKPEATMEKLSRVLGISYHNVERKLEPDIKKTYVGNKIDPERERAAYDILSPEQQKIVKEKFSYIFTTFYKD